MKIISPQDAFSKLKPESTVFVISFDSANNRPSGMVAGWSMKCSTDPYLYAVAIWKENYTYKLIQESKEFVVAVPSGKMEKYIDLFGTKHGNEIDKFLESGILTEQAKYIQLPLLKEAVINFECKLEKMIEVGDHAIFVGHILASYANTEEGVLLNMGKSNGKRVFQEFKG